MRKEKWSNSEKRLCQTQEILIMQHAEVCSICKQSFKEYKKFGMSNTPPCKDFVNKLKSHINNCDICNQAKKKSDEDAIPITSEMRQVVGDLSKGKLPEISITKKVASHLFHELELSSDEIKKASELTDKAVRDSLEKK